MYSTHPPGPNGAEANGDKPQVVQGIRLGKDSLVTVKDLEIALDAAVHVNRLLNQELKNLSEQLQAAEADRHAWEAHARRLARQLAEQKLAGPVSGRYCRYCRQPCAQCCWYCTALQCSCSSSDGSRRFELAAGALHLPEVDGG